jgi:hypothetical protein
MNWIDEARILIAVIDTPMMATATFVRPNLIC